MWCDLNLNSGKKWVVRSSRLVILLFQLFPRIVSRCRNRVREQEADLLSDRRIGTHCLKVNHSIHLSIDHLSRQVNGHDVPVLPLASISSLASRWHPTRSRMSIWLPFNPARKPSARLVWVRQRRHCRADEMRAFSRYTSDGCRWWSSHESDRMHSQELFAVLQTRELHTFLSVKLELIGMFSDLISLIIALIRVDSTNLQASLMCDLIFKWIVQQLRKDNSSLQELCEYVGRFVPLWSVGQYLSCSDAFGLVEWRQDSAWLWRHGWEAHSFLWFNQSETKRDLLDRDTRMTRCRIIQVTDWPNGIYRRRQPRIHRTKVHCSKRAIYRSWATIFPPVQRPIFIHWKLNWSNRSIDR